MIPASVVALMQGALARMPDFRGHPGGRMATEAKITSFQAPPFPWEGWVQGLVLLVPLA